MMTANDITHELTVITEYSVPDNEYTQSGHIVIVPHLRVEIFLHDSILLGPKKLENIQKYFKMYSFMRIRCC